MIVFDLDGTLIDSSRDLADAASALVQSYGGPALTTADVVPLVGHGAATLVARALAAAGLDPAIPGALERFLSLYDERLTAHTVPYDGIHEVLSALVARGPMAVLTNKPLAPTVALLEALGLRGFFDVVLGGDGPLPRKPDPTALRSIMAAATGPAVFVGDSPVDATTAAAADCPFILAAYGFGAAQFGASLPAGMPLARHPRELVALADTLTFDAARMPIVMR